MKILRFLCILILFGSTVVHAETVFVNGSFETANYEGWTLSEIPTHWEDPATLDLWDLRGLGTWGICQNDEVLEYNGKLKFDFADSLSNRMYSPGLPATCSAAGGLYHAFQLQDAGQTHVISQDLALPTTAKAISWVMKYKNHNQQTPFFRGDQRIRVSLKDLNGEPLKTLFLTSDGMPQEVPTWTTHVVDVSQFAGSTVRFEVEVSTFWERLDAFFDDFVVQLGEAEVPSDPPVVEEPPASPAAGVPPGWHKNAKAPKGIEKKEDLPKGLERGNKTNW